MAKYSPETKISACREYLEGKLSHQEICQKYGITFNKSACKSMINDWLPRYRAEGESAFIRQKGNNAYTASEKVRIVEEYLSEGESLNYVAAKYGIPSKETLRKWVNAYNAGSELNDYSPMGTLYDDSCKRFVTGMERKEITQYCFDHNLNYKETAKHFNVSYAQVYGWCKRSKLMKELKQKP